MNRAVNTPYHIICQIKLEHHRYSHNAPLTTIMYIQRRKSTIRNDAFQPQQIEEKWQQRITMHYRCGWGSEVAHFLQKQFAKIESLRRYCHTRTYTLLSVLPLIYIFPSVHPYLITVQSTTYMTPPTNRTNTNLIHCTIQVIQQRDKYGHTLPQKCT